MCHARLAQRGTMGVAMGTMSAMSCNEQQYGPGCQRLRILRCCAIVAAVVAVVVVVVVVAVVAVVVVVVVVCSGL